MQFAIEEKVIERAYKKLALDALVIQQGRLAEQKSNDFFKELTNVVQAIYPLSISFFVSNQ